MDGETFHSKPYSNVVFTFSVCETILLTKALLWETTSAFNLCSSALIASSVMSWKGRAFTFLRKSSMIFSPSYGLINKREKQDMRLRFWRSSKKLQRMYNKIIIKKTTKKKNNTCTLWLPHVSLQAALFSFRSSILVNSGDILKLLKLQSLFPSISDDMFGEVSHLSHMNPKALVTHTWSEGTSGY